MFSADDTRDTSDPMGDHQSVMDYFGIDGDTLKSLTMAPGNAPGAIVDITYGFTFLSAFSTIPFLPQTTPGGSMSVPAPLLPMDGDGFRLLPDDTKTTDDGTVLFRVEATRRRVGGRVAEGVKGGWVVNVHNLADDAWVGGTTEIRGPHVTVSGNAVIHDSVLSGSTEVSGNAVVRQSVLDDSVVCGEAVVAESWLYGGSKVEDEALVHDSTLLEASVVSGSARVNTSELSKRVLVHDAVVNGSNLMNSAKITGTATVTNSTVNRSTVSGDALVKNDSVVEGRSGVHGSALVDHSTVSGTSFVLGNAELRNATAQQETVMVERARARNSTLTTVKLSGSAAVVGADLDNTTMG